MWSILSDNSHSESFDVHGEAYSPMRCLVALLARRKFAAGMYAFKSMCSFNLTTAPTYQERAGHDVAGIVYDPDLGLFGVGYSEWLSPTRNPRYRTAASRLCEPGEVGEVIDRYVLRLLLSRRWSALHDPKTINTTGHGG